MTLTCLAALGAVGVAAVRTELRRGPVAVAVALLAALGVSQPLWSGDRPAHRPLADARIPDLYGALADLPDGAVVEVPLQYQPTTIANARFQYNQTRHGHPVLNCNQLIRRTDLVAFRGYVEDNAFLSTLVDLARATPPLRFSGADLQALRADGFRYVVLRRRVVVDQLALAGEARGDLLVEPAWGLLRDALGPPIYSNADGDIHEIPADLDPTRVWRVDGSDLVDVDFPLDALRYLLPVALPAGGEVPLWSGGGTQLSLWARGGDGGPVEVVQGERRTRLDLDPESWRFHQIPLGEGPVTLTAGADAARIDVALVQVRR